MADTKIRDNAKIIKKTTKINQCIQLLCEAVAKETEPAGLKCTI